jgi:hypothetical protein
MKKGPRYFTIRGKRLHLKSAREREIADREVDTIIAGGPWNNWNCSCRVLVSIKERERERKKDKHDARRNSNNSRTSSFGVDAAQPMF